MAVRPNFARNDPREIIVHCAATPEGKEYTWQQIHGWHKKRWASGFGYHALVHLDGTIDDNPWREDTDRGVHTAYHNRNTLGICYIGGVAKDGKTAKDTRTPAQKKAIEKWIKGRLKKWPKIKKIRGHRDYAAKACPSFDARREYTPLLEKPFNPKPMHLSGTVKGAGIATAGGAISLVQDLQEADAHISGGTTLGYVIGATIIGGAAFAMYRRWVDAGRPSAREMWRGLVGTDPDKWTA